MCVKAQAIFTSKNLCSSHHFKFVKREMRSSSIVSPVFVFSLTLGGSSVRMNEVQENQPTSRNERPNGFWSRERFVFLIVLGAQIGMEISFLFSCLKKATRFHLKLFKALQLVSDFISHSDFARSCVFQDPTSFR